jgi:flagellar assembly factor FliW
MQITTTRFGEIDVEDDRVLTFPSGIIGFPSAVRYVVLDHDREAPFKWLQSMDEGKLAFVIIDPCLVKSDYRIRLDPQDIEELGPSSEADLTLFVILTIPADRPQRVTANLRGPVVVNRRTRLAKQLVVVEDYPTRYPLFEQ